MYMEADLIGDAPVMRLAQQYDEAAAQQPSSRTWKRRGPTSTIQTGSLAPEKSTAQAMADSGY